MHSFASAVCLLLVPAVARGAALLQSRNLLTAEALDAFKPIATLAAAGYCRANDTAVWDCGENCSKVAGFIPTASGGDGVFVQYWLVGYYTPLKTVIVSHQGTRRQNIIPVLTDLNFFFEEPDVKTFPGMAANGIRMHNGFHDQHSFTYLEVLAAVQKTMKTHKTKTITLTGHSLGAALSVLDAIALKFVLPKDTQFNIVNFGQPRMGNPAFADYVDNHFGSRVIRFTNKNDQVPTLPGRLFGFSHFKGEVHIRSKDDGLFVCSGQDNESADCSIGEVPNVFSGDSSQHKGPYLGQIMKCFDKNGVHVRSANVDAEGD